MAKPVKKTIARITPLLSATAVDIGYLIEAIRRDPRFVVEADPDEPGSFVVKRIVQEE